jgi:hypothetical protein
MLDALLQYTVHGTVPPVFLEKRAAVTLNSVDLPQRMEGRNMYIKGPTMPKLFGIFHRYSPTVTP